MTARLFVRARLLTASRCADDPCSMKWFPKFTSGAPSISGFVARRRVRQAAAAQQRSLTLELAEAHVRVLLTMAAADDAIDPAELDAVFAYVDRVSLPAAHRAQLRQRVVQLASAPLFVDDVHELLDVFVDAPARVRALVTDLGRIATACGDVHPRQVLMMDLVCAQLGAWSPLALACAPVGRADAPRSRAGLEPLDGATQRRLRTSVTQALERSRLDIAPA